MSSDLFGYDMLVAITQNEIDTQFANLYGKTIDPYLASNDLSQEGGPFGGGGYELNSYLRGYIAPPTVALATQSDPNQVEFQFTFQQQELKAEIMKTLGVSDSEVKAAFENATFVSDKVTYALLTTHQDIAYEDNGSPATLSNQKVYYWLVEKEITIGNQPQKHHYLVPALYYLASGKYPTLIALDGVQIQFKVLLDKIPTTPEAVKAAVEAGTMPEAVLQTLSDHSFNSNAFSLQQLFLNFDTTDFTEWDTSKPDDPDKVNVLGGAVSTQNDQFSNISTTSLADLEKGDQNFLINVSTNLKDIFGVGKQDNPASTPYIIGISATSKSSSQAKSSVPPFLVPTYIDYSTAAHASSAGLAVLNYEVLAGDNVDKRIPKDESNNVVHVSKNWVTNNDFSGEMLFAKNSFFTPMIYAPVTEALELEHSDSSWHQSGTTFSFYDSYSYTIPDSDGGGTTLGTGATWKTKQKEEPNYKIVLSADGDPQKNNVVTVSGTMDIKRTLQIKVKAIGIPVTVKYYTTGKMTFSQTLKLITSNQTDIAFTTTSSFPKPTTSDVQTDDWQSGLSKFVIKAVEDVITFFFPMPTVKKLLDPFTYLNVDLSGHIKNSFSDVVKDLNKQVLSASTTNFISPTGDVFFLNAPYFNGALDLQMDVNYRV